MSEELRKGIPEIIIIIVGGIAIIIGLALIFLGLNLEAKVGGLVIIGPIPFFFYSEEPSSISTVLAIFIFLIILIFAISFYLFSRRLTPIT